MRFDEFVLQVVFMGFKQFLILAPADSFIKVSSEYGSLEFGALIEELIRIDFVLDVAPNPSALESAFPQEMLDHQFLQSFFLALFSYKSVEEAVESLQRHRLIMVAVGLPLFRVFGKCGVAGSAVVVDFAAEVSQFAVIVHKVFPDSFERLQS